MQLKYEQPLKIVRSNDAPTLFNLTPTVVIKHWNDKINWEGWSSRPCILGYLHPILINFTLCVKGKAEGLVYSARCLLYELQVVNQWR